MELKRTRVLLTGATGGIGQHLAAELVSRGARVMLVGRRYEALQALAAELPVTEETPLLVSADVSSEEGRAAISAAVREHWDNHLDVLINNAALMEFSAHEELTANAIHQLLSTNVEAPMQLTRQFLPGMLQNGIGQIVFVGSILGALGMPYFAAYSASKFALRGFAEALRREVSNSGLEVCYVGPRSVDTPMNNPDIRRMAEATGMRMDDAEWVASSIIKAMCAGRNETHLGFPESLFARINRVMPSLVDGGMSKQQNQMQPFVNHVECAAK